MAVPAGVDSTFEQLWKRLQVHAPELPVALAQEYVNTAYSRALASLHWSALRKESTFFVPTPYNTGTATFTQGSTTVTGVGTAWTNSMVGEQITANSIIPIYDILTVVGQTITIDRPFADVTQTSPYSIDQIYQVCPSDFIGFESVIDTLNNWRLHVDTFLQRQLDIWDPKRSITGTPWVMATARYDVNGNRRFEIWPRASSQRLYPFRYFSRPALLVNPTDTPVYPITGQCIREGALAELALYKGSAGSPNPYFDMQLSQVHEEKFWKEVYAAQREDQDIYQTRVTYEDMNSVPYAPIDARYLQTHDTPF